jgi:hypothetical protein
MSASQLSSSSVGETPSSSSSTKRPKVNDKEDDEDDEDDTPVLQRDNTLKVMIPRSIVPRPSALPDLTGKRVIKLMSKLNSKT